MMYVIDEAGNYEEFEAAANRYAEWVVSELNRVRGR